VLSKAVHPAVYSAAQIIPSVHILQPQRHEQHVNVCAIPINGATPAPFNDKAQLFVDMDAACVIGENFQFNPLDDARFSRPCDECADERRPHTLIAPFTQHRDAETGEPIDSLKQCLQTTSIPKLMVITSGFIPKNPTEVLGSVSMRRWIEAFQASDKIDIILIDTPPSLVVADSSVLATTVKADVIFVVEANGTRRAAAIRIKEQFEHLGCNIKGVVLNGINPRDEAYYGYGYYYTYYSQNAASQSSRRPALLKFLSGAGKDDGDDS